MLNPLFEQAVTLFRFRVYGLVFWRLWFQRQFAVQNVLAEVLFRSARFSWSCRSAHLVPAGAARGDKMPFLGCPVSLGGGGRCLPWVETVSLGSLSGLPGACWPPAHLLVWLREENTCLVTFCHCMGGWEAAGLGHLLPLGGSGSGHAGLLFPEVLRLPC